MSKPDGGHVHPTLSGAWIGDRGKVDGEGGETRRQKYAGECMAGLLAARPDSRGDVEDLGRLAWSAADALIATEEE